MTGTLSSSGNRAFDAVTKDPIQTLQWRFSDPRILGAVEGSQSTQTVAALETAVAKEAVQNEHVKSSTKEVLLPLVNIEMEEVDCTEVNAAEG